MIQQQLMAAEVFESVAARHTRRLRIRLSGLLGSSEGARYPHAERLEHLPDLFGLALRLAVEERVGGGLRRALVAAVVYVMNPGDVLPEGVVGPLGLADDLVVLALVVQAALGELGADVVAASWRGEGAVAEVVREILAAAPAMVGETTWERLAHWSEGA